MIYVRLLLTLSAVISGSAMNGDSNREIGENLFILPKTVENHLYSIYQKTDVRNRVQLVNLIHGNKAG